MIRRFYNITASVYSFTTKMKDWSLVQDKILLYENIKMAFWQSSKNYSNTALAVQTDKNKFEVNLYPEHKVKIWDIFCIDWEEYKVDQKPIPHNKSNWKLDNWQVFISKTEKDG